MEALQKIDISEIIKLHSEVEASLKTSLQKAIRIGEILSEVKSNLKHGEFTGWINKNLPFTDRTARHYMRLFENQGKALKAGSVTEAYRMLKEHKTETVSDLKGISFEQDFSEAEYNLFDMIKRLKKGETITGTTDGTGMKPDIINIKKYENPEYIYYELDYFNDNRDGGFKEYGKRPILISAFIWYLLNQMPALIKNTEWSYPGIDCHNPEWNINPVS